MYNRINLWKIITILIQCLNRFSIINSKTIQIIITITFQIKYHITINKTLIIQIQILNSINTK